MYWITPVPYMVTHMADFEIDHFISLWVLHPILLNNKRNSFGINTTKHQIVFGLNIQKRFKGE